MPICEVTYLKAQ